MIREAIVLAGGKGTRLKAVVDDLPKAMAPVNGRPFLEYQLDYLEKWGIEHVVLAVGYLRDVIINHFQEAYRSMSISYAIEEEPLGTGGALVNAFTYIRRNAAFVLNGDTYFDVNLQRLNDFRWAKEAKVCLTIRMLEDTVRYGTVEINKEHKITGFTEKGARQGKGFINGGVYLITNKYLDNYNLPGKFSLEKDFFEVHYETADIYAMSCASYFLDIGIPEDYQLAQDEFKDFII